MNRPRIYISGPLTSSGDPEDNVQCAIDWQMKLIEDGFAPLNPMLTWHADPDAELPHETWMEIDLPWVAVADAVLLLPGESRGAKIECDFAFEVGIPVYRADEYEMMRREVLGG